MSIYYYLISGKHPFHGEDSAAIIFNISMLDPVRLQSLAPDCPKGLSGIVHRALEKDPALRYQSFRDLELDAAPILRSLKQKEAAVLVEESRRLSRAGQLEAARDTLLQALTLDPSHSRAIKERERLQLQLDRTARQKTVNLMLDTAAENLSGGQLREAVDVLQRAVRLDPKNDLTKTRLQEARSALGIRQRVAHLVGEARRELDQRNLGVALELVEEACRLDSKDTNASDLRNRVAQVRQKHLDRELAAVEQWAQGADFDRALKELRVLAQEFRDDKVILHSIATITAKKIAHEERQGRLGAGLVIARGLLAKEEFEEAVVCLERLRNEFPEADAVRPLLALSLRECEVRQRAKALEQAIAQAQKFYGAGQFAAAIELLQTELEVHKGEKTLLRMLDVARKAQRAQEQFLVPRAADELLQRLELCFIQGRRTEFKRLRALVTPEQITRYPRIRRIIALADRDWPDI